MLEGGYPGKAPTGPEPAIMGILITRKGKGIFRTLATRTGGGGNSTAPTLTNSYPSGPTRYRPS